MSNWQNKVVNIYLDRDPNNRIMPKKRPYCKSVYVCQMSNAFFCLYNPAPPPWHKTTDTYGVIVFSDISFSEGSRREKHLKTIWITRIPTLQCQTSRFKHIQCTCAKPDLTGNEGFEHEMPRKWRVSLKPIWCLVYFFCCRTLGQFKMRWFMSIWEHVALISTCRTRWPWQK